eukprot:scaffold4976_cov73-Phaeocystis_antarctica.AAC.4
MEAPAMVAVRADTAVRYDDQVRIVALCVRARRRSPPSVCPSGVRLSGTHCVRFSRARVLGYGSQSIPGLSCARLQGCLRATAAIKEAREQAREEAERAAARAAAARAARTMAAAAMAAVAVVVAAKVAARAM